MMTSLFLLHSGVEQTDRSLYEEDNSITSNTIHQVDSQRAVEDMMTSKIQDGLSGIRVLQNNYAHVFMGVSFISSARANLKTH